MFLSQQGIKASKKSSFEDALVNWDQLITKISPLTLDSSYDENKFLKNQFIIGKHLPKNILLLNSDQIRNLTRKLLIILTNDLYSENTGLKRRVNAQEVLLAAVDEDKTVALNLLQIIGELGYRGHFDKQEQQLVTAMYKEIMEMIFALASPVILTRLESIIEFKESPIKSSESFESQFLRTYDDKSLPLPLLLDDIKNLLKLTEARIHGEKFKYLNNLIKLLTHKLNDSINIGKFNEYSKIVDTQLASLTKPQQFTEALKDFINNRDDCEYDLDDKPKKSGFMFF